MQLLALDSNIFLYVLLNQPPVSQRARDVLRAIELGESDGLFSALTYGEVLGEKTDKSLKIAYQFLDELRNLTCVAVSSNIGKRAGTLRQLHPLLGLADSVHLATAIEQGADVFMTHDIPLAKIANKVIATKTLNDL